MIPGTFRGFVEENQVTQAMQTGFSYLRSLGITHVQLMPVFDFGSVDEVYPQHVSTTGAMIRCSTACLEGSYSTDMLVLLRPACGSSDIWWRNAMKTAFRVNLDVVFNHVYDKENFALGEHRAELFFPDERAGGFFQRLLVRQRHRHHPAHEPLATLSIPASG